MASWSELEGEARDLAARARRIFEAHTHHTLATLRQDGSPRISGTEVQFRDGEVWLGSMWRSMKALDLRRDPRFALHSASEDPPAWSADAKLAGRAVEMEDPELAARVNEEGTPESEPSHLFRLEISELVIVGLNDARDRLVIESWHQGRGLSRTERR
jgi:hypothetical protein